VGPGLIGLAHLRHRAQTRCFVHIPVLRKLGECTVGYDSLPRIERGFRARLRQALLKWISNIDRVRRIRSERDHRETGGKEAADATEPVHGPAVPECSRLRSQWHDGRRIPPLAPRLPGHLSPVSSNGCSLTAPHFCMLSPEIRKHFAVFAIHLHPCGELQG